MVDRDSMLSPPPTSPPPKSSRDTGVLMTTREGVDPTLFDVIGSILIEVLW
jgi:hypothetical protein